jgi:hypothetical protein
VGDAGGILGRMWELAEGEALVEVLMLDCLPSV